MKVRLKPAKHEIINNTDIIEIWQDGKMIGTIYPTEKGIKVISKHKINHDIGSDNFQAYTNILQVDIKAGDNK